MKITADMLRERDACEEQVLVFEKEWPKGTDVTLEAALRAVELGLDLEWFAASFLSGEAWEAYQKAPAPAGEAYEKATAPAREAYWKAKDTAWEAYEKATAPALVEAWKMQEGGE